MSLACDRCGRVYSWIEPQLPKYCPMCGAIDWNSGRPASVPCRPKTQRETQEEQRATRYSGTPRVGVSGAVSSSVGAGEKDGC